MIALKKYKWVILFGGLAVLLMILTFGKVGEFTLMDGTLTFPLLMLFSLGAFYWIAREFFQKYSTLMIAFIGLTLAYLVYIISFDMGENDWSFNLVALPIPILVLLWLFERWKWVKSLAAEKEKAELATLKSQVNPHFFFNTLNNLHALAVKKSDQTPEVILKLSEMMRYTIEQGDQERVSINQEVDYLNTFIDLHKIRYQRDVDIRFNSHVDQELKVAPLLFITLLENAFKHGVESLAESAYIKLELKAADNEIDFTIENNFVEANKHTSGTGLKNLKARLALIYPEMHSLMIKQSDTIFSVRLRLWKL